MTVLSSNECKLGKLLVGFINSFQVRVNISFHMRNSNIANAYDVMANFYFKFINCIKIITLVCGSKQFNTIFYCVNYSIWRQCKIKRVWGIRKFISLKLIYYSFKGSYCAFYVFFREFRSKIIDSFCKFFIHILFNCSVEFNEMLYPHCFKRGRDFYVSSLKLFRVSDLNIQIVNGNSGGWHCCPRAKCRHPLAKTVLVYRSAAPTDWFAQPCKVDGKTSYQKIGDKPPHVIANLIFGLFHAYSTSRLMVAIQSNRALSLQGGAA